jgi:predicted RNase H-like HicB family nuclease
LNPQVKVDTLASSIPAAISQGETLEEAKANLLDALRLVLDAQRQLAEEHLAPCALREPIELVEA